MMYSCLHVKLKVQGLNDNYLLKLVLEKSQFVKVFCVLGIL